MNNVHGDCSAREQRVNGACDRCCHREPAFEVTDRLSGALDPQYGSCKYQREIGDTRARLSRYSSSAGAKKFARAMNS
jgi:hypothetical protein